MTTQRARQVLILSHAISCDDDASPNHQAPVVLSLMEPFQTPVPSFWSEITRPPT